jgi:hypothetical protein
MLLFNRSWNKTPQQKKMKYLILSLALLMMAPATFAANATSESTQMEHFAPGDRKMNKGRKATYGKKKGTKGTSCKKARKIMKRRGNW